MGFSPNPARSISTSGSRDHDASFRKEKDERPYETIPRAAIIESQEHFLDGKA